MNILGKILVFLNLLFALAVGGFLLIDFQTRKNWKEAYERLNREVQASRNDQGNFVETNRKLSGKIKDLEGQLNEQYAKEQKAREEYKKEITEAKSFRSKDQENAKTNSLALSQAQEQIKKFEVENKNLITLLEKRDLHILKVEQNYDKALKDVQQANNERDLLLARLDQMQTQLKKVMLDYTTSQVAKKDPGVSIKNKFSPNPPPFYIKGKILKVDTDDNTLVLLSLGSDQGLAVGQTLEAYRKLPDAKYLGMLRIEEVTAHNAVARLVPKAYGPPVSLRKDDEVASQILPGY